jgi:hypothetical protein
MRLFAGQTGLTIELFPLAGGAITNTGGDTLTETTTGCFTATVAESLSGKYRADVLRSGSVVYQGTLNTAISYVVDDPGTPGGTSVVVSPITSPMPSDVVGVTYPRAVGDVSPITVYGVVGSNGTAVDLTAQGTLEVVADYIENPELPNVRTNLLTTTATISGASNNDWTFTPNAATMALVTNNVFVALRIASTKKSLSEIRLNIRQAGLGS